MSSTNIPKEIRYTPTPNLVFGKLLDEIKELNDLKFILRIIWMINQAKRVPKYITLEEIISDRIINAIIPKPNTEPDTFCKSILNKPQLLNLFLYHEININQSNTAVVALNTARNKTMLNKIKGLDKFDSVFQPNGDVSEESSNIFKLYEDNIGTLNPIITDELKFAETTYPSTWITNAFKEYKNDVESLSFPAQEHLYPIKEDDLKEIQKNRINKESEFLSKNKVIEKITHEETQEDSVKTTQTNEITTWDKINFKNNFSFTYNSKKCLFTFSVV